MQAPAPWVVVGLDNGGTTNNATVLDSTGRFLVESLVETPSSVREGPTVAVPSPLTTLTIALCGGVTILLGVWPTQVLDLAGQASQFVR